MSYEEQLIKWAVEKYGTLDPNYIEEVELSMEEEQHGYCPTCEWTEIVIRVKVITTNGNIIIDETYQDYEFKTILKEIIEAGEE